MEKLLTISVAAYNAANDIENCLKSMIYTSVADYLEIIVVNDGSKDNTADIVKKYVEEYPSIIKLIDKENGGHGSTINASIPVATGKYYKIVDSDDWVDKEGIELLVEKLKTTDADLVLNPFYDIDADTRKIRNMVTPFSDKTILNTVLSIDKELDFTIFMHSITFKTEIVKKMGPIISEKCFYVDMEYTIFPMQYVKTYMCLEFPVYNYLLGTSTQSMNMKNLINRRNQHLHVTKRIITYYRDHKKELNSTVNNLILTRVKLAALSQYKIFFNMDPVESKKEIIEFDNWLKTTDADVYSGAIGRFMKIIKINRFTNFIIYSISVNLLKKLHMEPKL